MPQQKGAVTRGGSAWEHRHILRGSFEELRWN